MAQAAFKVFRVGSELGFNLVIFVPQGTYQGEIANCGTQLDHRLGYPALDGDFRVEDHGGMLIPYRIPDLAGTPNTFVLGDKTFDLASGHYFVLTPDYQAVQLPVQSEEEALRFLASR